MIDNYTICVSLESLLKLWQRIYRGTVDKLSYRQSLLYDIEVMLLWIVVPTHCIKSVLTYKSSNPFKQNTSAPVCLPHPCLHSCSFCQGEYDSITPSISQAGVCAILMDLFSGNNRISGDITFVPVLLDKIKKYPGCNQLVFGVKSKKDPQPIMVKKIVLVLIAANIICHAATVKETPDNDGKIDEPTTIVLNAVLG